MQDWRPHARSCDLPYCDVYVPETLELLPEEFRASLEATQVLLGDLDDSEAEKTLEKHWKTEQRGTGGKLFWIILS